MFGAGMEVYYMFKNKYLFVILSIIVGMYLQHVDKSLDNALFYILAVNGILVAEMFCHESLKVKRNNIACLIGSFIGALFVATLVSIDVLDIDKPITYYGGLVLCITVSVAFDLYHSYLVFIKTYRLNNDTSLKETAYQYSKWFIMIGFSYLAVYFVASISGLVTISDGVLNMQVPNSLLFYVSWAVALCAIPLGYVVNNIRLYR